MEPKKILFFHRLSFVTLFVTLFGSLFFFLPYMSVTIEASKGFLLSVGITLSIFFWLIACLGEGKFTIPKDRLILFGALIPLIFLIASFFSSSSYISLFGRGFEIGTFGSMLILFLLFFLSSIYFQTEKRLWYFFKGLFFSAIVLAVFEIINLFIGFERFFPGILNGVSYGNLIGSWSNFALFFGLIVLFSLFTLEFLKTKGIFLFIQYALLAISVFFLIILNLPFVWLLVGLFSLILSVYSISSKQTKINTEEEEEKKKKFPFTSLIILFICLFFLIGNNSVESLISKYINIPITDVRPSIVSTSTVAYKALLYNPLFGTGPNTFSIDWALWQPKEIAQTAYWNTSFDNGFSLILTFVATVGILGVALILLFIIVLLTRQIQSFRIAMNDNLSSYFFATIFMMSIYAWATIIFYTPNIVMLILAFSLSGILMGVLIYKKAIPVVNVSFLRDPRHSFFAILGIIILVIATISATYIYIEKFTSVIYFSKGLNSSGNTIETFSNAEKMFLKAIALDKNDIYYRGLSQIYIKQIEVVVNDKTISQDMLKSTLQRLVSNASESANLAVSQNSKQYLNYINLGDVFSFFVSLSVENSYENAVFAYDKAHNLSPNNPAPLFSRASLEYLNKSNSKAEKFIQQALLLKPNYADAMFLLAQIRTDEGNIPEAVAQATRASQLNPNDPTVFFKLGLLKYNNSDYAGAVSAFETAVILDNLYLNARYFLGQSYKKVGRSDDALVQFKILNKIIPDNKDVKNAINLFSKTSAETQATE